MYSGKQFGDSVNSSIQLIYYLLVEKVVRIPEMASHSCAQHSLSLVYHSKSENPASQVKTILLQLLWNAW